MSGNTKIEHKTSAQSLKADMPINSRATGSVSRLPSRARRRAQRSTVEQNCYQNRLRASLNLPNQSNVMLPVQSCPQKHSASLSPQITNISPAIPPR
jgi:hypothetical protein